MEVAVVTSAHTIGKRRVSIPSYSSFLVRQKSFSKAMNRLSLISHWAELGPMLTSRPAIDKGIVLW